MSPLLSCRLCRYQQDDVGNAISCCLTTWCDASIVVFTGVVVAALVWVTSKKDTLPAIRDFGWTQKPLTSAVTSAVKLPTGQRELRIKHDILK